MKSVFLLTLLTFPLTALSGTFPMGDAAEGQKLFEKYNCNRCHDSLMNGDGNKIFTRPDRKVNSAPTLLEQITRCSGNVGASLTLMEKQHLAAYLNRYYQLK